MACRKIGTERQRAVAGDYCYRLAYGYIVITPEEAAVTAPEAARGL